MADYTNKFLDANGVRYLWKKAETIYVKQDSDKVLSDNNYTAEEKEKLASLTNYELPNASEETLGGIKIGTGLEIDENGVVRTAGSAVSEVDWSGVQNRPDTIDGYGITDAVTKDELEEVMPESLSNLDLDVITGSASTEEALAALIENGGDLDLGNNLTVTNQITVSKDTTLDLNNHQIEADGIDYIFLVTAGVFTVKNGRTTSLAHLAHAETGAQIVTENVVEL